MTATSTRRAILAGAAALPMLSVPALASSDDQEILALGAELRRRAAIMLDLHDATMKLKAAVDRIERRLARGAEKHDLDRHGKIAEMAHATPQGLRYSAAWRKCNIEDTECWKLVDRLILMKPHTGPGLAEVIFACMWYDAGPAGEIGIDTAASLEAAAFAGGFELPRQIREKARAEVEQVSEIDMDRDAIIRELVES